LPLSDETGNQEAAANYMGEAAYFEGTRIASSKAGEVEFLYQV